MSVICFEHARLSCESHAHALLSAARFQWRGAVGADDALSGKHWGFNDISYAIISGRCE